MTYSRLVAILWLAVIMLFTALPADRCASPTDADCIRAVYKGVPDDYAQVQDIPDSVLIQPDDDSRYQVERGQQITVVTAAPLPTGYTRFHLQRRPVSGASPTSYEQLIPPIGTTYTFTSIEFEGAADELSFDLRAAKPPLRPGLKPQLGPIVVTVIFRIQTPPLAIVPSNLQTSHYNGAALEPGTYQFPTLRYNYGHLIIDIPTSTHQIKWEELVLNEVGGVTYCLSDLAQLSVLCFDPNDAHESYRFISPSASSTVPVTLEEVFNFISASARIGPVAPTLSAATAASGSIALSWSAGPASTTRWEYRRQQAGGVWGAWTEIAGADASNSSHTVRGLSEDVRYSFQLRAITAGDASPPSTTASAVAGLTPTVPSDRETLRYNALDSAGGAVRPASYAFLTDADDLTSGATTFPEASGAAALLLNTRGSQDRDYTAVLATVQVGDQITWYYGRTCWYSYRVTELLADPPAPARKLFKIALDSEDPCGFTSAQEADADYLDAFRERIGAFDWNAPPNEPVIGPDGIRILPDGPAVDGGHTYRLAVGSPTSVVMDVPLGMRIVYVGSAISSGPWGGHLYATYVDEASGGEFMLDPTTGEDRAYYVPIPEGATEPPNDVVLRFRSLLDSIRVQPLP